VIGYKLIDVDGKAMLKESKNIFDNELGTVLEPDFTTLFDDYRGSKSTSTVVAAKLSPIWDDVLFSEDDSRYTLKVPLEGAAMNSASISCQTNVGERCVLLSSRKAMVCYLVFSREKSGGAITHKVATILTGHNPSRKNRLTNCVVYSALLIMYRSLLNTILIINQLHCEKMSNIYIYLAMPFIRMKTDCAAG
jgi:hypothetical protein